jgi:hypothetical protein
MREISMSEKLGETKRKKPTKPKLEEYLRKVPSPPQEHTYELKMEKRLKKMIKEENASVIKQHQEYENEP